MKRASIFLFFYFFQLSAWSQLFKQKTYPQNYFQWPVATTPGLVANFGELRPNHYHMGLDCRTDGRENLSVLAAADGYIAKVNIDATGFGRAIYINHPNGTTTLYAHLNEFYPELEEYVTAQNYLLQQWKVKLEIPPQMFIVKKGQFIAHSGNTGGSQGPHVHFEIRDTKTDKVLNPLLFGLPIEDDVSPQILRLAIYDRRYSTYEQTPKIVVLKKMNGVYQPIGGSINVHTNKVSFAISAIDKYSGSTNPNGVYKATIFDNNQAVSGFEMDSVSYDETRYLNAHIDYKTKNHGGPFLQHLSPLPGYANGIYHTSTEYPDGIIYLQNNQEHQIKIVVADVNNNTSILTFQLHTNDLEEKHITQTGNIFKPNNINVFENNHLFFYLPEKALYDSFHLSTYDLGNHTFQIHNNDVPIHQYFPIKIKASFSIDDTGKVIMKQIANNKEKFKKANNINGWYTSLYRDFGRYQLLIDHQPPTVFPLWGFKEGVHIGNASRIAFAASDNSVTIESFDGYIDGKWVLFTNDKEKSFVYKVDKFCPPGEHSLRIIVKDLVGNITEKNYHFTR